MSATAALNDHTDQESTMGSLTKAFNFVAKGVLLYVGFGLFDLALWHYDPGGNALFEAVKDPLLSLLDVTGVSDALGWLADALNGSGTDQLLATPTIEPTSLELGTEQLSEETKKVVHHFGFDKLDHAGCTVPH